MSSKNKMVAESCFEFLHLEMIAYVMRQCTAADPGPMPGVEPESASTISRRIHAGACTKLEGMGFDVGQRLAELHAQEQPWFAEHLDVIKFICKDFWSALFHKQIDKLQTNYKGVYVLHDNDFKLLSHLSFPATERSLNAAPTLPPTLNSMTVSQRSRASSKDSLAAPVSSLSPREQDLAQLSCSFSSGVIRGALHALGMKVSAAHSSYSYYCSAPRRNTSKHNLSLYHFYRSASRRRSRSCRKLNL
jgi:hypothetical protein